MIVCSRYIHALCTFSDHKYNILSVSVGQCNAMAIMQCIVKVKSGNVKMKKNVIYCNILVIKTVV